MSEYQPKITENDGSFYALIIRIDEDGQQNVSRGYKGRHFTTEKAALKSTLGYIKKHDL